MDRIPNFGLGAAKRVNLALARVLLVHRQLAPRLALQTVLQAGGYSVDMAATESEALAKLDEGRYELVLCDADLGRNLLAYARVKEYQPATAVITSDEPWPSRHTHRRRSQISICAENLPNLLETVAELIGLRASRRYRPLRHAV